MFGHPSRSTAKSNLPGMTYTHLTQDERYQIAIHAKAGHDQSAFAPVMNRHKSTISRAMPFAARVHTLTTDNGKECAQHKRIAKELAADCHFAHPCAAGECGANENMNGLIRQFFPKKMHFNPLSKKDIASHTPPQSPPQKMPRLQNTPRGIHEAATLEP